jgi:predicted DNA-binding protein (MmcQ/YjbR family)
MELEALRAYLVQKKGTAEELPFSPDALVFKVMGKMYALVAFQVTPLRITLKCEPEHALFLRDHYSAVQPGYYMNKQHWNTITLDGSIRPAEILAMIDASYTLVVKGLKKAERQQLEAMEG